MTEFDRKCFSLMIHLSVFGSALRCLTTAVDAKTTINVIFWVVASLGWFFTFFYLLSKNITIGVKK